MTIQKGSMAVALTGTTLCGANCAPIGGGAMALAQPSTRPDSAQSSAAHTNSNSQAQIALARGRQLEAAGSSQLAQEQFRRATMAAPRSVQAWQMLARSLSRSQRWVEAAPAWREVMALLHDAARSSKNLVASSADQIEAKREFLAARRHLSVSWVAPDVVTLGASSDNPGSGHRPSNATAQADTTARANVTMQAQVRPRLEANVAVASAPSAVERAWLIEKRLSNLPDVKRLLDRSQLRAKRVASRAGMVSKRFARRQAIAAVVAARPKVLWDAVSAPRPAKATRVVVAPSFRVMARVVPSPKSNRKEISRQRRWRNDLKLAWAMRPLVTLGASSDNPGTRSQTLGNNNDNSVVLDRQSAKQSSSSVDSSAPNSSSVVAPQNQSSAVLRPLKNKSLGQTPLQTPAGARSWTFSFYLPTMAVDVPSRRSALLATPAQTAAASPVTKP